MENFLEKLYIMLCMWLYLIESVVMFIKKFNVFLFYFFILKENVKDNSIKKVFRYVMK